MDLTTQVQILDEAVCVSHDDHALEIGINPTFLFSAMGKL